MSLKRLLAAVMILCLAIGLCACSSGEEDAGSNQTGAATTTQATEQSGTQATTQATEQVAAAEYIVKVVDEGGNPVSGAFVQLCLDTCFPCITDENGEAKFVVMEADYKVSFVNLPEGYAYSSDVQEFYFEDGSYELTITLQAVA